MSPAIRPPGKGHRALGASWVSFYTSGRRSAGAELHWDPTSKPRLRNFNMRMFNILPWRQHVRVSLTGTGALFNWLLVRDPVERDFITHLTHLPCILKAFVCFKFEISWLTMYCCTSSMEWAVMGLPLISRISSRTCRSPDENKEIYRDVYSCDCCYGVFVVSFTLKTVFTAWYIDILRQLLKKKRLDVFNVIDFIFCLKLQWTCSFSLEIVDCTREQTDSILKRSRNNISWNSQC